METVEEDDTKSQAASIKKKEAGRDDLEATALANAANIGALKSAWDKDVLGDSPYV